jgi:DNA-binding IscR family transcriptional regulator
LNILELEEKCPSYQLQKNKDEINVFKFLNFQEDFKLTECCTVFNDCCKNHNSKINTCQDTCIHILQINDKKSKIILQFILQQLTKKQDNRSATTEHLWILSWWKSYHKCLRHWSTYWLTT